MRPLIVIGHRNPDTDSVCAAIAYADFKSSVESEPAIAKRAGNLNAQTRFALKHFGAPPPDLLADVHPRIRDIMIPGEDLILATPDEPVAGVRDLMLRNRFSFLPVADSSGTCVGKVTALGLASLMDEVTASGTGRIGLKTLSDLCGTSRYFRPDGKRAGRPPEWFEGDFALERFGDPIRRAEAGLVILTDAPGKSSSTIQALSNKHRVPVLAVACENTVAAALVRLSRPVSSCLEDLGPTFREDQTIREVSREVNRSNEGGFIVLDAHNHICGVVTRVNFMTDARFTVVLVDHNELSQSVDGMEHARILEIIDHHRIGGRSTSEPITFINRTVGSTCTIVADQFRQRSATPSRKTAGLLISGILSDTVVLRSPTTTPADRSAVAWLEPLAKVEMAAYGEKMFESGSEIGDQSSRDILERDLKYYTEGRFRFSVSQIEMVGFKAFHDREQEMVEEVDAHTRRNGLDFSCLMVTDITSESTLLVVGGESQVLGAVSYPALSNRVFTMNGVLSRKKQVLPYLAELVNDL